MVGGGGPERRKLRERKVSSRIAVVDDSARQQATEARLEALEADNDVGEGAQGAGDDDDGEFVVAGDEDEEEEVEVSGKRKKKRASAGGPARRKLRASGAFDRGRQPRSFQRVLDDAMLDTLPPGTPNYISAAVGPSTIAAPRTFCTVCGNLSSYKCTRCGNRYCNRKCYALHVETRCLKFLG